MAPATDPYLAVRCCVEGALRVSEQVVFVTCLLRPEAAVPRMQRFLLRVIGNPSGLVLDVPARHADV
jgi:hypothetical protein